MAKIVAAPVVPDNKSTTFPEGEVRQGRIVTNDVEDAAVNVDVCGVVGDGAAVTDRNCAPGDVNRTVQRQVAPSSVSVSVPLLERTWSNVVELAMMLPLIVVLPLPPMVIVRAAVFSVLLQKLPVKVS